MLTHKPTLYSPQCPIHPQVHVSLLSVLGGVNQRYILHVRVISPATEPDVGAHWGHLVQEKENQQQEGVGDPQGSAVRQKHTPTYLEWR